VLVTKMLKEFEAGVAVEVTCLHWADICWSYIQHAGDAG
jgi:hypothetical protein